MFKLDGQFEVNTEVAQNLENLVEPIAENEGANNAFQNIRRCLPRNPEPISIDEVFCASAKAHLDTNSDGTAIRKAVGAALPKRHDKRYPVLCMDVGCTQVVDKSGSFRRFTLILIDNQLLFQLL